MATLDAVMTAVGALLAPLVPATVKRVVVGMADQLNEFPAAWVWPGEAIDELDPAANIFEERTVQAGFIRLYGNRSGLLLSDVAVLMAAVEPVKARLRTDRTLGGLVDRFQGTGNGRPAQDDELGAVYVDIGWRAVWVYPDAYPTQWGF